MADFALDSNTMMIIIIVVVCAIMFIGPIMWFINWFFKRRDRMVESPIDVHEMLYHKYKKSARRNLRAIKNKIGRASCRERV